MKTSHLHPARGASSAASSLGSAASPVSSSGPGARVPGGISGSVAGSASGSAPAPAEGFASLLDESRDIIDRFEAACEEFGDRIAFRGLLGGKLSYKELRRQALRLASFLQNEGLQKGDLIILQTPNILQYPVSLWASLLSGLTVSNMSPLYTSREMLHQIQDSGAKAIILFSFPSAGRLREIIHQTDLKTVIVAEPGDLLSFPTKQAINTLFSAQERRRRGVGGGASVSGARAFNGRGPADGSGEKGGSSFSSASSSAKPCSRFSAEPLVFINFAAALKAGASSVAGRAPEIRKKGMDEPLFLQYTGGTTGISKGAVLSQRNILSNMTQCELWMRRSLKRGEERALAPLPLHHIFAFMINGLLLFLYGAENILIADPRKTKALIRSLKKRPVTLGLGVSALFKSLLQHPDFKGLDFSSCKFFISGGTALDPAVAKEWRKQTGVPVVEGYGLTEASPAVCCNKLPEGPVGNPAATDKAEEEESGAGFLLPFTEARVADEAGRTLPFGEAGELQIKGPQVMQGYYKREGETQNVFSADGWLKTGDVAVLNEKGFVKIKDRKKDMINVSGFKVFPNEVEQALSLCRGVQEAAVVGVPNGRFNEAVKAFVVRSDPLLTEEDLRVCCRKTLAPYKAPKWIEFIEEMPKTPVGKPLRKALRGDRP